MDRWVFVVTENLITLDHTSQMKRAAISRPKQWKTMLPMISFGKGLMLMIVFTTKYWFFAVGVLYCKPCNLTGLTTVFKWQHEGQIALVMYVTFSTAWKYQYRTVTGDRFSEVSVRLPWPLGNNRIRFELAAEYIICDSWMSQKSQSVLYGVLFNSNIILTEQMISIICSEAGNLNFVLHNWMHRFESFDKKLNNLL